MKILTNKNHKVFVWIGRIASIMIIPFSIMNGHYQGTVIGIILVTFFWAILPYELHSLE